MFNLEFGGLVPEVVCGSGTITAPYDDVTEVYCYSGIRAWALVSLSSTLFSCVLFLLNAPESLLVLVIDAAVTWKPEFLT